MPHAIPCRQSFQQSRALTRSGFRQTRVPIVKGLSQFVAHGCYILQMTFYLRELCGGEASYLSAGSATAIKDLEDFAEFVEREPDQQRLPDHPDALKCVLGVLPITIARPLWPE